jgi:hypothetical protein
VSAGGIAFRQSALADIAACRECVGFALEGTRVRSKEPDGESDDVPVLTTQLETGQ